MRNNENLLNEEIQKWEYLTHWVAIEEVAKSCTSRLPTKKLHKFHCQSFGKKHEALFNRLYLQKMILIAVAAEMRCKLYISKNLFQKNELVYGLYRFEVPGEEVKRLSGVELIQQFSPEFEFNEEFKWFHSPMEEIKNFIKENNLYNRDEYIHWMKGIRKFHQENQEHYGPYGFLHQLERLPLSEHYVFKVKLENARLIPIFLKNSQMKQTYKKLVEAEKQLIEQIFANPDCLFKNFKGIEAIGQEIFNILFDYEKIGQAQTGIAIFEQANKNLKFKQKQKRGCLTFTRDFAIILSRYRGIINEEVSETMEQKDKPCTKIEIKACNGAVEPISGNLIFVQINWEISCKDKQTKLLLKCCNNRKVHEIYTAEVYDFWQKLQANEKFMDLMGVDKFMIAPNDESENLEVIIVNYVPSCQLTSTLKEVDKIVVLTLVLDEVIEICQKKGNEQQNKKWLKIEPYMIEHAIMRFQKAIKETQRSSDLLYRQIEQKEKYY